MNKIDDGLLVLSAQAAKQAELEKYISDGLEIYGYYREPLVPIDEVRLFPKSKSGAMQYACEPGARVEKK